MDETDIACLAWNDAHFTPREQAALHFAELFSIDHLSIDEAIFSELARHFSKPEIVELSLYVASVLGGGRLARVYRAYGNDEKPALLPYEGEFAPANELA